VLPAVVAAARAAGEAILRVREGGALDVRLKADGPVTAADLEANRILHARLSVLAPDAGWLSEETADSADRLDCRHIWVVDPLDGTQEFISGRDDFAVSVALVEDGLPILAALDFPARGRTFWATPGEGAWMSRDGSPPRRLHVSERTRALRILARFTDLRRGWTHTLRSFAEVGEIRPMGATVAKMVYVARGEAEAFGVVVVPPYQWDVCAADLLVREAGGAVSDLEGAPLTYNHADPRMRDGLLVSNGDCHRLLLGHIAAALKIEGATTKMPRA